MMPCHDGLDLKLRPKQTLSFRVVSLHSCCVARRKVREMLTEDPPWTAKLLTASNAAEVHPDLLT